MSRKPKISVSGLVLASALAGLLVPVGAWSGDWHTGDQLACSDCHTIHNSSGGQPMRYDNATSPSQHLLRHATTLSLCLYCHDGTNPSAPDVLGTVSYVADPAAGWFANSGGVAAPTAHDLGMDPPETPPGGSLAMTLTCVSCHDPHGGINYRNLRANPLGTTGTPVTVLVTQTEAANGTNPSKVYVTSNLVDKSGMSEWCGTCHGAFHGRTSSEEGTASPWFRHPQDKTISGSAHADYNWWRGTITNRVRVANPTDGQVPTTDDQVFCLSCHKAHGSANKWALIFSGGTSFQTTCQECHNK